MSDETIEMSASQEQDLPCSQETCDQETNLPDMPDGIATVEENPAEDSPIEFGAEPFLTHDADGPESSDIVPPEEGKENWPTMLQPLFESLEQVKNAQIALTKDFAAKLKYDATKQGQIDKLYRENQAYRDDVIEKFKLQLILAVIEQIDDAEKQISHFARQEETEKNYAKLLGCFSDVTVSFQDMLLERFDVSSWQCEPGTPFDPKRQRALKTSDTSDASLNKTVAATLRPGYEKHDGTVVRPEMVEVYRHNPALRQELSE